LKCKNYPKDRILPALDKGKDKIMVFQVEIIYQHMTNHSLNYNIYKKITRILRTAYP